MTAPVCFKIKGLEHRHKLLNALLGCSRSLRLVVGIPREESQRMQLLRCLFTPHSSQNPSSRDFKTLYDVRVRVIKELESDPDSTILSPRIYSYSGWRLPITIIADVSQGVEENVKTSLAELERRRDKLIYF